MVDRRSFLNPRRLFKQVHDLQTDLESALTKLEKFGSVPVVTMQRDAMACTFELQFGVRNPDKKQALAAFDLIDELEAQLTVYDDQSEVSRLNDRAALTPVVVEDQLFELLHFCLEMGKETDGAFDITAGPLVRTWGFKRRQGRLPDEVEIHRVLETVGWQRVKLDFEARSVKFDVPGMEINLGGVGKGYALDRVAEEYERTGRTSVLMNAGLSSLLAVGKPYWDKAWQIDVLHPLEPGMRIASVRLANQGFSTSGVSEQHFWREGKRYSHILDPRTGWPVPGVLQVSVVAPSAVLAEVLSTAFFVNGLTWSRDYCQSHPEVGALYVLDPGPAQPIQVQTIGAIAARVDVSPLR